MAENQQVATGGALMLLKQSTTIVEATVEFTKHLPDDSPLKKAFLEAAYVCLMPSIPQHIRGNPLAVAGLRVRAEELGITFGAACEMIYALPNGRNGMESKLMRGLLIRHRIKFAYLEQSPTKVSMSFSRDGMDEPYIATWTKERAEAYPVWISDKRTGEKAKVSLWEKWRRGGQEPQNMLGERCTSEGTRKVAADLLGGVYLPDEAIEIDSQPVTAESLQQQAGVEESNGIDESVIRPEDEVRLRQMYKICGLKPEAAVAKLKEIQVEAESADTDSNFSAVEWAAKLINREIARLKEQHIEDPAATRKKGGRPRKQTASEMAAEEPAKSASIDKLAEEQGVEPLKSIEQLAIDGADDLGVTQEDGEREPEQAAFGTTW